MSFLGIGISIPFIADPSFWIINLLGEKYEPAGEALAILAFMVIIQSINYPLADNLTTIGKQWKRTITMSLGLCVAIVSYILLGSYLGMMGQRMVLIITEISLLLGFSFFIHKGFNLLFNGVIFNFISFIISYILYRLLFINMPALIALTITCLVYAVIVVIIDLEIRNFFTGFLKIHI